MNKAQLIDAVALKAGTTKADTRRALEAFVATTAEALKAGDKITLSGFGSFSVERKNSRVGRDPRNGAPIKIAAKNVVRFRPGQELSESLK